MPRQLVNREQEGKVISKTSGAITMIDDLHYSVRSESGFNTYIVAATKSEWVCSCPDYARHNAKCKHVYAVEFLSWLKRDISVYRITSITNKQFIIP
ncbi:MAG TPA: SWIM zinc finger family protein [Nitrososphaeraceae archaeon]|jgi:hypothetical protein